MTSRETLTVGHRRSAGHEPVADCATVPDGEGLGSRIDTSVPSVMLFRPEGERGVDYHVMPSVVR